MSHSPGDERKVWPPVPVGLLSDVQYEAGKTQLSPGARLVVVTDGVTEAEDPNGDMYGCEHLTRLFPHSRGIDDVFSSIGEFCAGTPLNDDCTVVQLSYQGQ